jgi:hypothetical protein
LGRIDALAGFRPTAGTANPAAHPAASTWNDVQIIPRRLARTLLLAIQLGYLVLYIAVLSNFEAALGSLNDNWDLSPRAAVPLLLTALAGIAARFYIVTATAWKHPAAGQQYRKLFPALLALDGLWAAAPLLLKGRMGLGLALACAAGLAYLPFAQKTLAMNAFPQPPVPASGSR